MAENLNTIKRRMDRPFVELLKAQERYAKADAKREQARETRDAAIRNAAAAGSTRRSIAQAANLTAGRVQQIIDGHR